MGKVAIKDRANENAKRQIAQLKRKLHCVGLPLPMVCSPADLDRLLWQCSVCGVDKQVSEYYRSFSKTKKRYIYSSACKECCIKREAEKWRDRDYAERQNARRKKYYVDREKNNPLIKLRRSIKNKEKRMRDKEELSEEEKKRRLDRQYLNRLRRTLGVTEEEYNDLLLRTGNLCEICDAPATTDSHGRHAVDHCHETGKVCGLLCDRCNQAIGLFLNCPRNCVRAGKYLERTRG